MGDFRYVPLEELRRIRGLAASGRRHELAALFATACRINALYMIARAGSGHIGTTFSSMDIVSWLYLYELRDVQTEVGPLDVYFSSKGHDVPAFYAVMIALERLPFDRLHQLRRLDGLPGHPDVETPHVMMNTGSLGMGISKAKGITLADRLAGHEGWVFVLTGDGELQEGQVWESLQQASNLKLSRLITIVDRNQIQSDTWVRRVNDYGDLAAKFAAFGWHAVRCDGHDFGDLEHAIAAARAELDRPTAIIAETVKGKGVSFMEGPAMPARDQMYRFHSGAPDADAYERALDELVAQANRRLAEFGAPSLRLVRVDRPPARPSSGTQRLVAAYGRALVEQAARDARILVLDADLVFDCGLVPFRDRFPERFLECGIAEQDMVSMAGGLAARGYLPIVHSFACFLSARPNEQIYNNVTERRRIIYVGSLAGLLPGGPGHSHQCVRDISSLGGMPHLVLIEPSCESEVELALEYCVNEARESCYLRLVSITCQIPFRLPSGYRPEEGRGVVLREGNDAVIIGYGPVLLTQAYQAAEQLARETSLQIRLVNLPWLNRIDPDWLGEAVRGCRQLFTLDDQYTVKGQGPMILNALALCGWPPNLSVRSFGIDEVPRSGQNDEVLRAHGLDATTLCKRLRQELCAPVR